MVDNVKSERRNYKKKVVSGVGFITYLSSFWGSQAGGQANKKRKIDLVAVKSSRIPANLAALQDLAVEVWGRDNNSCPDPRVASDGRYTKWRNRSSE